MKIIQGVACYEPKDLTNSFNKTVEEATNKWIDQCKSNYKQYGDEGSCVLSAGIYIFFIPSRCRKPIRKMIITQYQVQQCQGSLNWERGKDTILQYLKDNGIEARFNYGNLD